MAMSPSGRDHQTRIESTSLVAGPLLMSIGDLLHPEERMAPAEQVAILVDHASSWYVAHLLLFVGVLRFIPGFLALSVLTAARNAAMGYAARILTLVGTAAAASIFVGEMLVGRYVVDGADPAAATDLLESMFSGPMIAAVGPAMLALFAGIAAFAIPLMRSGGAFGWPAALILVGSLMILAEILSALVILSQIGNVLIFCGSATIAWRIRHGATREAPPLSKGN